MKLYIYILLALIFLPNSVYASLVSYEAIETFHKSRVDAIIQEYDLDKRMKITFTLSPKSGKKNKEAQIIKLPGLLLDVVSLNAIKKEVGLVEIIEALKEYNRKIVILKSTDVSKKEVQVVQKAIQEELFIKSSKSFSVKEWTANTGYQKFKSSLYSGILMSPKAYMGIFAFLVISFLIFSLASSIMNGFKHMGKSIYDSVEKSLTTNQNAVPMGTAAFDEPEKDEQDKSSESGEGSSREVIEEYNNVEIDCQAISNLLSLVYSQKPNELSFKMWDFFPEIEDQLNLYVTFESHLEEYIMNDFKDLFQRVFNVENSMSGHVELKPKAFNATQVLWSLQVALTHLSVKPLDEKREKLFDVFSTNYQGQIDQIIDESISGHYKILNYLFPDRVMAKVENKAQIDEDLSRQIVEFLTISKSEREPSELELISFSNYLSENNYFADKSLDADEEQELSILSRLSDHVLFDSEKLNADKLAKLRLQIPNFSWLSSSDGKMHKQFVLSLTPEEAAYFINNYEGYSTFKGSLDSRTLSRMQEFRIRAKNDDSTKIILGLRKKIKYFYKPVENEGENEIIQAA